MDELKIVEKLGIVTSSTVQSFIDKNIQSIIKQLNSFEKIGEIKIINTRRARGGERRYYMTNEMYNIIGFEEEKE